MSVYGVAMCLHGCMQILYGRKERPQTDEASPEVHIQINSAAPSLQPNPLKTMRSKKIFYVVEIPELSEPRELRTTVAEDEVLKEIQLARERVRSDVCRDSVSSYQA